MRATFVFLRVALTLILAIPLTDLAVQAFTKPGAPTPTPLARINPYAPNPYVRTGRPFLCWHAPGAQYVQAFGDYAVTYRINARGFRGPDVSATPAGGQRRLLVIGDSVVEGAGVEFEETFVAHLHDALRRANWEVVNGAMQGGSPLYYDLNLPRYEALHPAALVVILSENDLAEDRVRESTYSRLPPMADPLSLVAGLPANPPLALGATWRGWFARGRAALRYVLRPSAIEARLQRHAAAWRASGHAGPRGGRADYADPAVREAAWALTRPYLDDVYDACRREGIRLAVATLNLQTLVPSNASLVPPAAFLDHAVAAWAQAHAVPCRALAAALPADTRGLITADAHLSREGHRVIAADLQAWLADQNL
ncbi:MAG: hypothetical protein K8T26_03670 [Lentisphaerae bacterium]|nr:hypothetical protein [Lentisphaerota bacterium]